MPRGRHRHSPPLHRLLPPTAIAGVSLVCALGPWIFSEPSVLRVSAAVAAATAAVGAAVMRRWDVEAGKRVADLTRARASDEWRHEEKIAELETDLDESRELRTKLEHKLRAKRTELANLRNEHAALLRRYATAETERASALEGRRLLEIEATAPEDARALPAGPAPTAASQASPVPPQGVPVQGAPWAAREGASKGEAVAASDEVDVDAEVEKSIPAVFSPAGSALFLQANSALERMIKQRESVKDSEDSEGSQEEDGAEDTGSEAEAEAGAEVEAEAGVEVESEAVAGDEEDAAEAKSEAESADQLDEEADDESAEAPVKELSSKEGAGKDGSPKGDPDGPTGGGTRQGRSAEAEAEPVPVVTAEADEPAAMSEEVDGREHAAAEPVPEAPIPAGSAESALPALPDVRPAGHFTVPTAVAVVPAAPQRRAAVEGGFDFFGTQKEADAFEAVQNEDLADVVGQEAFALHKAESEAQFKRVDEASRGIGQVIDLTAHDETEQIDVQGLRTAAS